MKFLEGSSLSRVRQADCARLDRHYVQQDNGLWTESEEANAVAVYPVSDSSIEGKVNFLFKETMPAEGVKGLDNPSTITGVSSINVSRTGKNLFGPLSAGSGNGWSRDSNYVHTITTNGDNNINVWLYPFGNNKPIPAGTYVFSLNNSTALPTCRVSLRNNSGDWGTSVNVVGRDGYVNTANYTRKIVIPEGSNNTRILVNFPSGTYNTTITPQFELGDVSTDYESPVKNEYAISLGSTYYGGNVDFASGIMTITWGATTLTGEESWSLSSSGSTDEVNVFYSSLGLSNGTMSATISSSTRACTHFVFNKTVVSVGYFNTWGTSSRLYLHMPKADFADETALSTWLASENTNGTPVIFLYMLETPQVVQLDPVSISALIQTNKYTPRLNTVYSDVNSVQIRYKKSPIREAYEQRQAIASIGGV